MTASWQLKLRRAYEHFEDIAVRLRAVAEPGHRSFPVKKDHRADGKWYHSLDIRPRDDEMLPVVIGDFLFNLRSALDHIAVFTGNSKSQFPIFTDDIWEKNADGTYAQRFKSERTRWNDWTQDMKADVLALVQFAQPYNAVKRSTDPENDALEILRSFHNADKHRELNILVTGITDAVSTVPGFPPFDFPKERGTPGGLLRNGAVFVVTEYDVDVELVGEVAIALTRGPELPHRALPILLQDLMLEVTSMLGAIERAM